MTPKEELKKLVANMNDKQFEWFVAQLQNLQRNAEKCREMQDIKGGVI